MKISPELYRHTVEGRTMSNITKGRIAGMRAALCGAFLILLLGLAGCGDNSSTQPTQAAATATVPLRSRPQSTCRPYLDSGWGVGWRDHRRTDRSKHLGASSSTATVPAANATSGTGKTFTNPILNRNFPDPFVLQDNGVYYAYATNGRRKNIQEARQRTW